MHQRIKFILFWNDSLHVPDGLFVHHQEFKTVIQQQAYVKQILLDCWLASNQADSSICMTNACCCMYSFELLMIDGKTVRNM